MAQTNNLKAKDRLGPPHFGSVREKHFVSKTENDTKIAQMPLKWQENE